MTEEKLITQLIVELGASSDRQLDTKLAAECKAFDGTDPVRFARNLLDKCVRYGAASSFVVVLLEGLLEGQPKEPENEREARQQLILDAERSYPELEHL
jgi:hypothetical protein